jgi:hypothetical protein
MALYPEGTFPLPLDDVQRAANKANELSRQALGQNGAVVLHTGGNLTSPTDSYVSLVILKNTTISSITAPAIVNAADLTGHSLTAGVTINGDIRQVTLTSGTAILYKA